MEGLAIFGAERGRAGTELKAVRVGGGKKLCWIWGVAFSGSCKFRPDATAVAGCT